MRVGDIIKFGVFALALLIFILSTIYVVVVNAQVPFPVGVAGVIVVNGDKIQDGYLVTVKNENTGETVYDYTDNGYFVVGLSGDDGEKITASIEYNGILYSNSTIVNTTRATQWINISISTDNSGEEDIDNKKPVIILPDVFEGYVGNEVTFDASSCYDPDGYIVKYEWTFYDYPPTTMIGKVVKKVFNNVCNIMGVLTVYDNNYETSSKTFNIIIKQYDYNDNNETSYDNNSSNDTIVTFPPMPPIANFSLVDSYYKDNILYINLTSTSTDPDGYIVNWTWTINGIWIYYGENITVGVPTTNESFVKLNVTLLVTDNDGLYDDINALVTINTSWLNEEKYHLIIHSDNPVFIKLSREGKILDNNYGTHFEYYLPRGIYEILYTYNGVNFNKTIKLNNDEDIFINTQVNSDKIPSFEFTTLIIALVGVIIYVRKKI